MAGDPRDNESLLIAPGSFAAMDAAGETLSGRWSELLEVAAEASGRPLDAVLRVAVGLGWHPRAVEFADEETCTAIGEGLVGLLLSHRLAPVIPLADQVKEAVDIMSAPDWSPHWCAVQALMVLHGVSAEAATTALFHFDASEEPEMSDPAYRASIVANAGLFIQHSETLH